jgi:hypothetical protein
MRAVMISQLVRMAGTGSVTERTGRPRPGQKSILDAQMRAAKATFGACVKAPPSPGFCKRARVVVNSVKHGGTDHHQGTTS